MSSFFLQCLFVYNKNLVFIINKNFSDKKKTSCGCCFYITNIKKFLEKRGKKPDGSAPSPTKVGGALA